MVRLNLRDTLTAVLLLAESARAVPGSHSHLSAREVLRILDRRQNTCPSTAPLSCRDVDPKLPNNFCCPTGTSCISLDSSTTALCCPTGSSCSIIQPIDCDVSLQDPLKHRVGPVFTTKLTDSLAQCPGSNKCCPFGYTCGKGTDGSALCQIIASTAISQSTNSSASSASSATSASRSSPTSINTTSSTSSTGSTSSSVSPASASSIDSTNRQSPQASNSSNPFPPTVFLAGFFPGMLVGALGVLAWVVLTGRHRRSDSSASATSSIYKPKPYISGPIPVSTQMDSIRKDSGTARSRRSLFSKRRQSGGTPGLPFDNWKMPTPPEPNNIPNQPVGRQIPAGPGAKPVTDKTGYSSTTQYPVTPERQIYGALNGPGPETIHVYSPRELEPPSASVAPLRGMNSRERTRGSGGFDTPDRSMNARAPVPPTQTPNRPYDAMYEMLTPARYEGNATQKRPRPENAGQQGRPETTFTTMLQAINFPDPMNQPAPRIPDVPSQYTRR